MTKITNNTGQTLDFAVGFAKGAVVTKSVKPGATEDLEVDLDSAQVKGRALSGAITLDSRAAAKVEKAAGEQGAAA